MTCSNDLWGITKGTSSCAFTYFAKHALLLFLMQIPMTDGYRICIVVIEMGQMGEMGEICVASMTDIAKLPAPTMQRVDS